MSKKLSRARRKELREQGQLEEAPRAVEEARRELRRAESDGAAARVHVAREEVAARGDDAEESEAPARPKARHDRTVLVLVALTALAALIFWLTQRSPTKETKIEVSAPVPAAASSARP